MDRAEDAGEVGPCWRCWRSMTATHSPPSGHPLGVPAPGCQACAQDPKQPSAGKSRSRGGFLLMEDSQRFSGPQLRAAACCLPWGPSPSPFFEAPQRLAIKPGLCLTSGRLNLGTHCLPRPRLPLQANLERGVVQIRVLHPKMVCVLCLEYMLPSQPYLFSSPGLHRVFSLLDQCTSCSIYKGQII